ncbi:hypothetical protein AKJ65_01265 [candidate division MSBL1 archaeon SCGC-AAA259E19]|uniref:DUF447 domain-containing protein n=1 Tax=candidate division MSBL1 archaeon SCGC-AAA259E19 TaxID=1698264 RepID=A0A133UN59_9EURY|nr:hypothetical protein AKJ65_01265 [candidate division MSBL1 archaeon SCGC-AAA259E19]
MSILQRIGFRENSPAEVILTSFTPEGDPHAASVGVYASGEKRIKLNLFAGTESYENLFHSGSGVANVVTNPEFLIKGGLPDIFDQNIKSFDFGNSKVVNAPSLSDADAKIEFEVEEMKEKLLDDDIGPSKFYEVKGAIKNVEIINNIPRSFKRTDFYLIESAIIGSKALEAQRKGNRTKFEELIEEISFFKDRCKKISPRSKKCRLIRRIIDYLEGKSDE